MIARNMVFCQQPLKAYPINTIFYVNNKQMY